MMRPSRARWFKTAVALGFVLGILLLGHTLYTFRYVVRQLVLDHVAGVALRQVSELENAARFANAEDAAALDVEVEAFREASSGLIDSIRIVDQSGRLLAATEGASLEPLPDADREAVLENRTHHVVDIRPGPRGELLVVALPFRYQFPAERAGREPRAEPAGQLRRARNSS